MHKTNLAAYEVERRLAEAIDAYRGSSKFSGESDATLYYYSCYLDGDGDFRGIEGQLYSVFEINATERKILSLPARAVVFTIIESDSGFVYGEFFTAKQWRVVERKLEEMEAAESELE